ncbi:hypothetical protein V6N11_078300 [Hibiscus sabdariffa]|uniref:Uncharacterized protein n=1 Tax=Hibiscus sabdariffa TaxID=183260 RepID=A0ABR2TGN0_9ROSI
MALLTSSIEGLSTTTRNAPNVELLGTNSEAVSTCTDNYSNVVLQGGRRSGAGPMQQPLPFMQPEVDGCSQRLKVRMSSIHLAYKLFKFE